MPLKTFLSLVLAILFSKALIAAPVEDHFYIDGVYMFNVAARSKATELDFNEAHGYTAFAGYRFNSYFSIEVGGIKFDPIENPSPLRNVLGSNYLDATNRGLSFEYDVAGYSFGIRGDAPVGDLFTAWMNIGIFSWDSTFSYDINYPNFPAISRSGSYVSSGEDYFLRLGITHPISESFQITIETMQMQLSDYFGVEQNSSEIRLDYMGIGVGVRF